MKIEEAAEQCKVRGYIKQTPGGEVKLWKDSHTFNEDVRRFRSSGPTWECFDPEGEETSMVG